MFYKIIRKLIFRHLFDLKKKIIELNEHSECYFFIQIEGGGQIKKKKED